jgi:NADP-dependent 3-hydroxy acid dehydrogenase YdfG
MSQALEGRTAAITGASSGIGEATALELARAGAAVAVGARRRDRLESLVERIESEGGKAIAVEVDVSNEAQSRAFIETAQAELGSLSILVNNAGVMLLGPVEGASPEDWRRMVDVNVCGVLWCTHAALPLMREGGGGDIVNVSSVAGRRASAGAAVYNLTKFGVTGFSEALRQEALHSNIRVSVVVPGMVDTELQGHNRDPAVRRSMERSREAIGDPLMSDDIAREIAHAVSQPPHVCINEIVVRPTRQAN